MKANNGRAFEKLVYIIQQALVDSPNTQIFANYKIADKTKSRKKREFDIFIISSINGYDIKVAIECKDYRKPVGVEKVEAFKSKCDSIKGINKKIMVSPKGFQSGAIENATDLHDIELYDLELVNVESVQSWMDIENISRIIGYRSMIEAWVTLDDDIDIKAGFEDSSYYAKVTTVSGSESSLLDIIKRIYLAMDKELSSFFSIEAFKMALANNIHEVSFVGEKIVNGNKDKMWMTDEKGGKHFITAIKYVIGFKAVIDAPYSVDVRGYKKYGETEKLSLITANFPSDSSSVQFVRDQEKDNETAFYVDKANVVRKLDSYGSFDVEPKEE